MNNPTILDIKQLCWIAWRNGSIGSGDSMEIDRLGFTAWWEKDAEFLITCTPLNEYTDFDKEMIG